MEEIPPLDRTIPPEQAISLLENAFARLAGTIAETNPSECEMYQVLRSLRDEATRMKQTGERERTEMEEKCRLLLSEYTAISSVVQQMEDTIQELRFTVQSYQKELDVQKQRTESFQHSKTHRAFPAF